MRREERVTVQGPVKEQQPDGMSHRGGGVREKGSIDRSVIMNSGAKGAEKFFEH